MAFRSPSPFQLLAALLLFALVISPAFADPLEEEKHIFLHGGSYGGAYAPIGSTYGYGGAYGPIGRTYGYGGLGGLRTGTLRGRYGGIGCKRASSCVCHCMNGRVATATELKAHTAHTKP